MYVALTRARRSLSIYVPRRYYHRPHGRDDGHGYGKPSRFLTPAVQALCDVVHLPDDAPRGPFGAPAGAAAADRRVGRRPVRVALRATVIGEPGSFPLDFARRSNSGAARTRTRLYARSMAKSAELVRSPARADDRRRVCGPCPAVRPSEAQRAAARGRSAFLAVTTVTGRPSRCTRPEDRCAASGRRAREASRQ